MKLNCSSRVADKMPRCAGVLILAAVVALNAAATGDTPAVARSAEVAVQVRILEMKTHRILVDESGAVVWLVAVDNQPRPEHPAQELRYRLTLHHKAFQPHLLVVPVGSRVEFANLDPWFHDAFSISHSRSFDVGLFRNGIRHVEFDRAGASYVFCRLHPEMEAVVLAVDSPYFGVSDRRGHVSIANVPPGRYLVHVWFENASRKALAMARSRIVVAKDSGTHVSVSIADSMLVTDRFSDRNERNK